MSILPDLAHLVGRTNTIGLYAGSPGVWTGRDLPFILQDKGYHFLDQNGTRMSQYPMLPLFAAADAIHDKEAPVDWPAVDVITTVVAYASSSAGSTRLEARKCATFGSMWNSWARRPSF